MENRIPGGTFFNNYSHVKNYTLAKQVFRLVKNKLPEAQLKVISNVPHHQTIWYYNAADVLLLTSLHESSNNSVKEAMACNLPVISVDAGDAKERLQDVSPSFVSDKYDAVTLANNMVQVLELKHRSNGQQAVQQVELNTTARIIIRYYHELYNSKQASTNKTLGKNVNDASEFSSFQKDSLKHAS
jgi:teichuronic acid biosynthesis glycosyltransferase TuaC